MSSPRESASKPSPLSSLFDLDSLKAAGTFLGVVGSGSGGFATLSFAIGYLAIKKQGELLGIPTTVSDTSSYIRTGALFFSNSAYHLFSVILPPLVILAVLALSASIIVVGVKKAYPKPLKWPKRLKFVGKGYEGWFLVAMYAFLLIVALYCLMLQAATFDSQNRNLLYTLISDKKALFTEKASSGGSKVPDSSRALGQGNGRLSAKPSSKGNNAKGASELQSKKGKEKVRFPAKKTSKGSERQHPVGVLSWPPWISLPERVNQLLRHHDGRSPLQRFYGQQLALILGLGAGFLVCHLWRKSFFAKHQSTGKSTETVETGRATFFTLRIISSITLFVMLMAAINLPAAYGILCLPTSGVWSIVHTTEKEAEGEEPSGYLLTDLSSSSKEVWLLGNKEEDFNLWVLDRSKITDIILTRKTTDNFLALRVPK